MVGVSSPPQPGHSDPWFRRCHHVRRSFYFPLRSKQTRETVSRVSSALTGLPWHGYPLYPLQEGPGNRCGEACRPERVVFDRMVRVLGTGDVADRMVLLGLMPDAALEGTEQPPSSPFPVATCAEAPEDERPSRRSRRRHITPAGKNTTEKTERKRGATTDATDEHGSREKDQEEAILALRPPLGPVGTAGLSGLFFLSLCFYPC
jgi:hypothetical protein